MNTLKISCVSVLTCIVVAPKSIYELAKWVDRDFPAVLRDCIGLESTGFIQLKEKKDSKGSKQPKLAFSYSRIIVNLPNSPYQIEIREAV
jgi:predicted transcriptional regulator